jgi:hypothetical protein
MPKNGLAFQYLVPTAFPHVDANWDAGVSLIASKLKGIDMRNVKIPNTALSVQLFVMLNGASLEFQKRGRLVYVNLLCYEADHAVDVFEAVKFHYQTYNLGIPQRPKIATWIHSIPTAPDILRDTETFLCEKLTVYFYAAVYGHFRRERNLLN